MGMYLVRYRKPSGWEEAICDSKGHMEYIVNVELNNNMVEEIEVHECTFIEHYKYRDETWEKIDPDTKVVIGRM